MPLILNIETSSKNCSVSVAQNGVLLAIKEAHSDKYIHAESLHPFINSVFKDAEASINDLDAVAVSHGPGSYTGLRIGVSAAKGLCYSLNIPLIGVDTTRVLLCATQNESSEIFLPVIDARRNEVYTQIFNADKEPLSEIMALELNAESLEKYAEQNVLAIGDAALKTADLLGFDIETMQVFPSSRNMIALTNRLYSEQQFVDVAYHEPFYLKDFVAGKPKKML